MWCLPARRLISAFIDHELDADAASRISIHMEWCRWCRKELERVQRGARLARAARGMEIPPANAGMLSAITEIPRERSAVQERPLLRFLAVAAAAVVIIGLLALETPYWRTHWPFGRNSTVYALDFGFKEAPPNEDLLNAFRARYAGKFREFAYQGKLDPAWVPFAFKYPAKLPRGLGLKSVMIFDPHYCGSLGLIFSDGTRNLYLVQQPADRPISLSGLKTTTNEACKYNATHCTLGRYRIVTWTADNIRSVLLSNLEIDQIEATIETLRYQP